MRFLQFFVIFHLRTSPRFLVLVCSFFWLRVASHRKVEHVWNIGRKLSMGLMTFLFQIFSATIVITLGHLRLEGEPVVDTRSSKSQNLAGATATKADADQVEERQSRPIASWGWWFSGRSVDPDKGEINSLKTEDKTQWLSCQYDWDSSSPTHSKELFKQQGMSSRSYVREAISALRKASGINKMSEEELGNLTSRSFFTTAFRVLENTASALDSVDVNWFNEIGIVS